MPEHIKALIFVSVFSTLVFYFSRKAFGAVVDKSEIAHWQKSWLVVTGLAFLTGNFWLFVLTSSLYLKFGLKSLKNKFPVYLILFIALPSMYLRIPGFLDFSYITMLGIAILIPLYSTKWRFDAPRIGRPLADKLLIALILLFVILNMRGTTFSDSIRSGITLTFEWFLPYFIASRVIKDFNQLKTAMIALMITCMIAGVIGIVEYSMAWVLYHSLPDVLNANFDYGEYLARGGVVRAPSSVGHALALGFITVVAFGFYLFLSQLITDKKAKLFCIFSLAAGFLAPLARGSWVAASALVVIFISIGPKVVKRYMILLVGLLIAIQVLPIFPAGKKIINLLPFIGNVDQFNVDYRERLVERSFILINRNPFFGVYDPMQHPFFEDMIQGQGIVDITNSYLLIGLNGGYTALILFVWFFVFTLFKLNKALKKVKDKKSEEHLCGRVLFATLSAVLINMISVGLILVIPTMVYILVGFIFSYIRIIEKNATIKY